MKRLACLSNRQHLGPIEHISGKIAGSRELRIGYCTLILHQNHETCEPSHESLLPESIETVSTLAAVTLTETIRSTRLSVLRFGMLGRSRFSARHLNLLITDLSSSVA